MTAPLSGTSNATEIVYPINAPAPWNAILTYSFIVLLICLTASFSGLTLGLMGLDNIGLEIVMKSGKPKEQRYAKKIYPVRKRGNLLLCTLILGNVMANTLLSILMDSLTNGLLAFFISTGIIVIAGEIVPQAVCSRYALAIGAHMVWLVWIFIVLLFPIAWPISLLLNAILGREIGPIYSREELKTLMDIHKRNRHGDLTDDETVIIEGALDFSQKTAKEIMTPIDKVFALDIERNLDLNTLREILESGHSRIPVYEGDKKNIVSILLVKELLLLNIEAAPPLRKVVELYGRVPQRVFDDDKLPYLLHMFKRVGSHFAIVRTVNNEGPGDPFYETIGIVTLEDVLEEILQDEILDEADISRNNKLQQKFTALHWASPYVRKLVLGSPINEPHVTTREQKAFEFLREHELFKKLSRNILMKLIHHAGVLTLEKMDGNPIYLYEKGKSERHATLILEGKVEVTKRSLSQEDKQRTETKTDLQHHASINHSSDTQLSLLPKNNHIDKNEVVLEVKSKSTKNNSTEGTHSKSPAQIRRSNTHLTTDPIPSQKNLNHHQSSNDTKATKELVTLQTTTETEEWETLTGPIILGLEALTGQNDVFVPDFTARVVGKVHIVKISRTLYAASIKATQFEKELHEEIPRPAIESSDEDTIVDEFGPQSSRGSELSSSVSSKDKSHKSSANDDSSSSSDSNSSSSSSKTRKKKDILPLERFEKNVEGEKEKWSSQQKRKRDKEYKMKVKEKNEARDED